MKSFKDSGDMGNFKKEVQIDLEDAIEHGILVSILARMLSKELDKSDEYCYEMAVAGLLHDIGKMRLSRYLYWRTDEALKVEEMKYVRMHSTMSYDILKDKGYSKNILDAILYHHENYDGSGYPNNLKKEEIPEGARILRTCDVFAALVTDRPYRTAFDMKTAVDLMIDEIKNFDMRIFLAFQRMVNFNDFSEIVYSGVFENITDVETIIQYFSTFMGTDEELRSENNEQ